MKARRKDFFAILAVVIISGVLFSVFAYSKIKSIRELRAGIEKSGTEKERLIERESDPGSYLTRQVPKSIWTTEFIETAYAVSKKYGIRDISFDQKSSGTGRRQGQAGSSTQMRTYPVRMTFISGYRELAEFVRELQGLEKLVTIENIRVKREKNYLAVELTANTYAMEENNARQ